MPSARLRILEVMPHALVLALPALVAVLVAGALAGLGAVLRALEPPSAEPTERGSGP